jgi:hypothetical protein
MRRLAVCSAQKLTPLVAATCCPPPALPLTGYRQARPALLRPASLALEPVLAAGLTYSPCCSPSLDLRRQLSSRARQPHPPSLNPERDRATSRPSDNTAPCRTNSGAAAGPSGDAQDDRPARLDVWHEISRRCASTASLAPPGCATHPLCMDVLRTAVRTHRRRMLLPSAAMTSVVLASNYLVQFPVNEWLTYGTLSYPLAFLITNVINR